jgi:hypothetical protein
VSRRKPVGDDWRPGQMFRRPEQADPPKGHFPGQRIAALRVEDPAGHLLIRFFRYYDPALPQGLHDMRGSMPPDVVYKSEDRVDGQPHTVYLTCLACVAGDAGPRNGWPLPVARIEAELAPVLARCREHNAPDEATYVITR